MLTGQEEINFQFTIFNFQIISRMLENNNALTTFLKLPRYARKCYALTNFKFQIANNDCRADIITDLFDWDFVV